MTDSASIVAEVWHPYAAAKYDAAFDAKKAWARGKSVERQRSFGTGALMPCSTAFLHTSKKILARISSPFRNIKLPQSIPEPMSSRSSTVMSAPLRRKARIMLDHPNSRVVPPATRILSKMTQERARGFSGHTPLNTTLRGSDETLDADYDDLGSTSSSELSISSSAHSQRLTTFENPVPARVSIRVPDHSWSSKAAAQYHVEVCSKMILSLSQGADVVRNYKRPVREPLTGALLVAVC